MIKIIYKTADPDNYYKLWSSDQKIELKKFTILSGYSKNGVMQFKKLKETLQLLGEEVFEFAILHELIGIYGNGELYIRKISTILERFEKNGLTTKKSQKDYLDPEIRKKLISFLEKRNIGSICQEIAFGKYIADIFIPTRSMFFVYEIKSYKDDLKRFFVEQLKNFLFASKNLDARIFLVIPECNLDKLKAYLSNFEYDCNFKLGVITFSDKLAFKQHTYLNYIPG